jgi:hypothetical protein
MRAQRLTASTQREPAGFVFYVFPRNHFDPPPPFCFAFSHDQTDPHLTRVSLHFYLNNGELEYFSMLDAIKSYYPSTRCEVVIGASSMDLGTNEESIALRELQNKTMRLNQNKTRTVIRDNVIKEIHLEFSNAEVGMNLSCYRSAYSPYPITLSSIQSNLGEYFILQ